MLSALREEGIKGLRRGLTRFWGRENKETVTHHAACASADNYMLKAHILITPLNGAKNPNNIKVYRAIMSLYAAAARYPEAEAGLWNAALLLAGSPHPRANCVKLLHSKIHITPRIRHFDGPAPAGVLMVDGRGLVCRRDLQRRTGENALPTCRQSDG
jgi:hypothetical protein